MLGYCSFSSYEETYGVRWRVMLLILPGELLLSFEMNTDQSHWSLPTNRIVGHPTRATNEHKLPVINLLDQHKLLGTEEGAYYCTYTWWRRSFCI